MRVFHKDMIYVLRFHSGEYSDCGFLGCRMSWNLILTVMVNMLPPSSGSVKFIPAGCTDYAVRCLCQWVIRFQYFGLLYCVVMAVDTNIFEEYAASTFSFQGSGDRI